MINDAKPIKLKLGNYYLVKFGFKYQNKSIITKFIQPTPKGFNFLDVNTNKCILKHHVYPSKKLGNYLDVNDTYFWIQTYITINNI